MTAGTRDAIGRIFTRRRGSRLQAAQLAALLGIAFLTGGCVTTRSIPPEMAAVPLPGPKPEAPPPDVVFVDGVRYVPDDDAEEQVGVAAWYGPGFDGRKTASGERFDQDLLTAAHRTLDLPSLVKVTNLDNGKELVLRINDRGPYTHGRIIDISKRGAELLGYRRAGSARVRIQLLEEAPTAVAAAPTAVVKKPPLMPGVQLAAAPAAWAAPPPGGAR